MENYYDNALKLFVEEDVEVSYLPMLCFEDKKYKMKNFRNKLLTENDFDCNNTGLGRVQIPGSLNNLKSSSVIALYLRNSNQIDVIEEEQILDILQNTNYSSHISIFSYVLHSFGYR